MSGVATDAGPRETVPGAVAPSAPESHREAAGLLTSAGKILGLDVTVTAGDEWVATEHGARIGLGYFASRGYSSEDAVLLSLRDLWASVRAGRAAPGRAHRRRTVLRDCPPLAGLLTAIDRVQAEHELLAAMPGLARGLRAATLRGVPEELRERPLDTQWVGAILRLCAGADTVRVDAPVREELIQLLGVGVGLGAESDTGRGVVSGRAPGVAPGAALLRVLAVDPARTPLERLDRALALLAPPLLRLRERAGCGLSDGRGAGHGTGGDPEESELDLGLGAGAAVGPEADPEPGTDPGTAGAAGDTGDAGAAADEDPVPDDTADAADPATAGDPAVDPEQLVESAASRAPDSLLDIPLPSTQLATPPDGRQLAAERAAGDPEQSASDAVGADGGPGPARGPVAARLSEYRSRVARHRDEIRRVREVWREVLHRGVRERRTLSRRALPEGEALHRERLAGTVTELRAGVPRPAAFRARVARPREADAIGNTDYLLVLDRSASMQGAVAEACADAAMVLLESLAGVARDVARWEAEHAVRAGLGLRAGVIVFDDQPRVVASLTSALDETTRAGLSAAIRDASGQTNAAAALRAAAVEFGCGPGLGSGAGTGPGDARRRVLLFVGDGDADDAAGLARELTALRARDIEVCGIGIGSAPGMQAFAPDTQRVRAARDLPRALAALLVPARRS